MWCVRGVVRQLSCGVSALWSPTAARIVALRAGGLVSPGAWALGERGGALGERCVGAVCGARRATWCVRGVLRTLVCARVRRGEGAQ